LELYSLNPLWRRHDCFWVTFKREDTQYLLRKEKVYWAHSPTNRNLKNFFRNLYLAAQIIPREKPGMIISTGAGVSVPFFYIGRILGIRTLYIESMARIKGLSLTGRLVYPVVHDFYVQWPELALMYRRAIFRGQVV
jgi:UDP-N-acetylglucosamine:LPS N-acetylglucosamine transferase